MGCWGMGMTQSDQFMETYETFMDEYNDGAAVPNITKKILEQYLKDFSADDPILHDVWFGLECVKSSKAAQTLIFTGNQAQIIRISKRGREIWTHFGGQSRHRAQSPGSGRQNQKQNSCRLWSREML